MRIFLTGATGYIGGAVLDALVRASHDVTALVRNGEKARGVAKRGAHPVIGNLADPESCRANADGQDGAYPHGIRRALRTGSFDRSQRVDDDSCRRQASADCLADVADATLFVIYTSGVWVLGNSPQPATEDAPINPVGHVSWRPEHEQMVLDAHCDRLRTIVIRPGVVYGRGSGIIGDLFKAASNGLVRVVGDGNNHWPLIYDRDLAELYARLAGREDSGGVYHANDEGDERVNDIVDAIKPYLPLKPDVRHVPIEEASKKMGPYAEALALDQVVRSPRARALGWTPTLHSVSGNAARLLEEWRTARN